MKSMDFLARPLLKDLDFFFDTMSSGGHYLLLAGGFRGLWKFRRAM